MDKEIKFRVWHKTLRELFTVAHLRFGIDGLTKVETASTLSDNWRLEDVELMQFTGLSDKNGREIYEGDIVATGSGPECVKSIVRIGEARSPALDNGYSYRYYGVYLEGSFDLEDLLLDGQMLVVGNIYEKPEQGAQS